MNKWLFRALILLSIVGILALRVVVDIWISESAFELKDAAKTSIGNSIVLLLYLVVATAYMRLRRTVHD